MAQVLKEELRLRILESAKQELLEKGYRDASMRRIAARAHMTVGNLYRYFKSKDELIDVIVAPAVNRLNAIIQEKTKDRISLYRNAERLGFSQQDIVNILDSLTDDLLWTYNQYSEEMTILMLHSEVREKLIDWFTQLIQVLVNELFEIQEQMLADIYLLSRMMAVSIFNGLQECFRLSDSQKIENQDFRLLIRIYFRCFINMLNLDPSMMKGIRE